MADHFLLLRDDMAKRKKPHEKTMEKGWDEADESAYEEAAAVERVNLTLPIGESPNGNYEGNQARCGKVRIDEPGLHVNAQLGKENALTFLRIRNGLRATNAKLANGRPVWTNVDALRWMMEHVEIPKDT